MFEVVNADQMVIMTACTVPLEVLFDWARRRPVSHCTGARTSALRLHASAGSQYSHWQWLRTVHRFVWYGVPVVLKLLLWTCPKQALIALGMDSLAQATLVKMIAVVPLMAVVAFAASFLIARHISLSAKKLGLVQVPNHRSSHVKPTASGGGLGIAIAGCLCALPLVAGQSAPITWAIAVSAVGGLIGFLDDRLDLPARYRIGLHIVLVGVLAQFALGLSAPEVSATGLIYILTFGAVLFLGVWWINLFNFMDGIDGIAASEAIFILASAAFFVMSGNSSADSWIVVFPLFVVVAACLGFLLLNWPPARVFMGDAGSNYLAFFMLGMSFVSFANGYMSAAVCAILPAAFVADATVTLLRRVLTGERWFAAHREHAYQRLARRWNGHLKVTLLYGGINMVWLLPLALVAHNQPSIDWLITLVAYIPLVALCIAAQVGLSDKAATNNRKPT